MPVPIITLSRPALLLAALLVVSPTTTAAKGHHAPNDPEPSIVTVEESAGDDLSITFPEQEQTTPAAAATDPKAAPTQHWTLERLIQEATMHNPETLVKRAGVDAASASVDAARYNFFPTPYVQVQQAAGHTSTSGTADQRLGVIGLSQPIWTGGKLTAELDAARSSFDSAGYSVAEIQLSLATRVVAVYQGLLQYHLRMQAQEESIRVLDHFIAAIGRRVSSGVSAPSDRSQVEARLALARSDLAAYTASRNALLSQLSQMVGTPIGAADIEYTAAPPDCPFPGPEPIIAEAFQTDPTIKRLQADAKTVEYQEKQQRAALLPTISVKAEHRDDLFPGGSSSQRYGEENLAYLSVDFAPGAGLSTLANVEAAKARVRGAQLQGEAYRRDLATRISSDYIDYLSTTSRREMLEENVRTTRSVLESYSRLFVAGKRSWLDVLNAARELTQGQLAVADTVALSLASAYRLKLHAGDQSWLHPQSKETINVHGNNLAPQ